MSQVAVRVEHLTKRFRMAADHGPTFQYRFSHPVSSSRRRSFVALDDVSFDVMAGETVGITGPNGCGKSTLLKLLCGIYEPDEGRIAVNGRISPFLELGVGFKFEMTARENVFLGGAVLGVTHRQLAERVEDVLEFAELQPFADQKLRNFSSGMVVRLAFSVAMLADADILLMDEVLAVGDASFQEKCFEVFDHYKRARRTVILVSHDLQALETYCDRVLLFHGGRIINDGRPDAVVNEYRRLVAEQAAAVSNPVADLERLSRDRRWGSGELRVTSLRLLGAEGGPQHTFLTGEPLVTEARYEGSVRAQEWRIRFEFHSSDGHLVGSVETRASREMAGSPDGDRGQWVAAYRVDSLSLVTGSYTVTVTLLDAQERHTYDHLEGALEFRVSDPRGRPGLMAFEGSWSLDADRGANGSREGPMESQRLTVARETHPATSPQIRPD